VAKLTAGTILIFVAMIFDALDGTIARLTKQTTKFGAQLDSLADVVTFGVAPAFLAKVLIEFHHQAPISLLPFHPKLYYVAAAVYLSCAALRLARFNVESSGPDEEDHKEFKGLPSPAAAAAICALVAFRCHIPWRVTSGPNEPISGVAVPTNPTDPSYVLLPAGASDAVVWALPFALVIVGLLMVSRLPYPHLMYQLVKKRHSFGMLLGILAIAGFAALEWEFALLLLTVVYLASGFAIGAYRFATTGSLARAKPAQIVRIEDPLADDKHDVHGK
jgi:CDP-diacylglycerol--serine O-phosphatidyltransferase